MSPSLHLQFLTLMMPVVRRSQVRFPVGDAEALARFRTRSERMANMVFSLHLGVTREGSSLGGVAGDWPIPPHAPDNPLVFLLEEKGSSWVGAIPTAGSLPPSRSLLGCRPLGRITVSHRSPATRQPKMTASRSTGRLWARTHRSC